MIPSSWWRWKLFFLVFSSKFCLSWRSPGEPWRILQLFSLAWLPLVTICLLTSPWPGYHWWLVFFLSTSCHQLLQAIQLAQYCCIIVVHSSWSAQSLSSTEANVLTPPYSCTYTYTSFHAILMEHRDMFLIYIIFDNHELNNEYKINKLMQWKKERRKI